jgi:hypothetical protein
MSAEYEPNKEGGKGFERVLMRALRAVEYHRIRICLLLCFIGVHYFFRELPQ